MNSLQPGQMLGAYRIIDQIGQGGMATVYKAYQPSMDRSVAIKVLPSQLAESKEFTKRFQQEARIIARLEHAHILPVFDYGETDGITYFVMRYLEAGTLKNRMEAGPLSMNEVDRIFTQLAHALGYAHSQGVVHRDLKPANALVDSQGNLFLTDFGIAKILESSSARLTQTDAIMGTPAYISPEQAQAQTVDQRSDIYSLGVILYEMITGRVPFVADTPLAVILKHVSDPLPLPSSIKPDIPEAIEQVILKALAKDPDDRFATAAEFVAAWKRALDDRTPARRVLDAPTSIAPRLVPPSAQTHSGVATAATSKPVRSRGWVIGCLLAACLLFSIAGVAFFASTWQNLPFLTSGDTSTDEPSPLNGNATEGDFEIEIGDEISNGQPDAGAGLIEEPGSKDIYTFTAQASQDIYIHVIEIPQSSDLIDFYMSDELGSDIFSTCLQCGDPGLITLDRGGAYTVTVGNDDPDGAGTGTYRIKIWDVPPPDEFAFRLNEEISRDQPGKGAGYIENPGSSDIYTFTTDARQEVYFQVKEPPQSSDLISWRLEDDQENELFNTCLQCGDPGLMTLDRGGTYRVIVGNQSGAGTGTYTFKLWSVPPPDEYTINIGDAISNGVPGEGAGSIETPGAQDVYSFMATSGQTIAFDAAQLSNTNNLMNWRLVDEEGNDLFNTCLQCGAPDPITIDRDGTYTIVVGSEDQPGTGTYEFRIYMP